MENIQQNTQSVSKEKNKLEIFCEKYFHAIFWSILAIASIIWFSLSFHKQLWLDEVYTLRLVKYNFSEIWQRTALDVHPPLYYFLLKIFLLPFKNAQLGGRLFSVIPFLLIAIFGGLKIKKFFGVKYSLLFIISFCFFPGTLKYSVDIRMYSLSAAFVFFCGIYAYEIYKKDTVCNWIIFGLMGVCAAYTHYFAFVSIIIVHLILIIALLCNKEKRKLWWKWLVCVAASILLYSPWAANFIKQLIVKVEEPFHIPPITINHIIRYPYGFFGSNLYSSILYVILTCIAFIYLCIAKDTQKKYLGFLCAGILLLTIIIGIVVSLIIRPIFVIRYALPCAPILCVFFALSIGEIKNSIIKYIVIFSLIIAFIPCCIITYKSSFADTDVSVSESTIDSMGEVDCFVFDYPEDEYKGADYIYTAHNRFIAYYKNDINVFIQFKDITDTIFFDNIKQMNEFDANNYSKICVIVPFGRELPSEYLTTYEIVSNGDLYFDSTYTSYYVLSK